VIVFSFFFKNISPHTYNITGAADVLNPEYCSCWSGFASQDTLAQTDCNVNAGCAGQPSSLVGAGLPSVPISSFRGDTLFISQHHVRGIYLHTNLYAYICICIFIFIFNVYTYILYYIYVYIYIIYIYIYIVYMYFYVTIGHHGKQKRHNYSV